MEAPTCRHCGKKHWSRQPCGAAKPVLKELAKTVTKIRANKVTKKRGRPQLGAAPLSSAEKMKRYRAKKGPQGGGP